MNKLNKYLFAFKAQQTECKGYESRAHVACLRSSKELGVAGLDWMKGKLERDEVREVARGQIMHRCVYTRHLLKSLEG